jgi:hypothetical protein
MSLMTLVRSVGAVAIALALVCIGIGAAGSRLTARPTRVLPP